MAGKVLKACIDANGRGRVTTLLSIPFVLPLLGLILLFMTQGVAGYSAPASNGTFDLQISKTDNLYHVLPGTAITYTIYYTNAWGSQSPEFHVIECPPSGASVQEEANPDWRYVAPCYWRYPAANIVLDSGVSDSITFTVTVPLTAPYGTQLDNKVSFSIDDPPGDTQGDNSYTDTDIVVPGFNFTYLPLVTKAYAP